MRVSCQFSIAMEIVVSTIHSAQFQIGRELTKCPTVSDAPAEGELNVLYANVCPSIRNDGTRLSRITFYVGPSPFVYLFWGEGLSQIEVMRLIRM